MQIETHKHYDKMWARLNRKQQLQVLATLKLFISNQYNQKLRVHQLKGKYYPQYSISAGGDLRIHYLKVDENRVVLMMVGTHSQLYR
jgi:mRNA-degrading endonuclease YafQ of YafQ-DinJ toxin-antitoxin module